MPTKPLLSIVCPAYQEDEVLPRFHAALVDALDKIEEYDFEILYVDDGSPDGTLEVMRQLAATDPRVRYLSLSRNFGQQAALTAGLEHATGDAIISMDTDLQHPPRLIPALLAQWQAGADVVHTIRADDPRLSFFKRFTSRLFYRVLGWCSTLDVRAGASDYRLLSRRAVDALVGMRESHRYMRGMVQWLGFRSAEVPFEPDARGGGVSKYTLKKLFRLAFDGLLSFSPAPYRMAVMGAASITALSAVLSIAAVLALVGWSEPVGRLGVIALASVHVLIGAMLGVAWPLGEFVFRIYEQSKGRPNYAVKESTADAPGASVRLPVDRRPQRVA